MGSQKKLIERVVISVGVLLGYYAANGFDISGIYTYTSPFSNHKMDKTVRTDETCNSCKGSGKNEKGVRCLTCNGVGRVTADEPCMACRGNGKLFSDTCRTCVGTGKRNPPDYPTCGFCNGSGKDLLQSWQRCRMCGGIGKILPKE